MDGSSFRENRARCESRSFLEIFEERDLFSEPLARHYGDVVAVCQKINF